MISRLRRTTAERRTGNALVPVYGNGRKALPRIYLQKTEASTPAVFLPESGDCGAGARFKWLVSTCLAGVVGVGVIGASVYASMNVEDGSGVVSSIKRAGLAAMQPAQRTREARRERRGQMVTGRKTDRIRETARGLATTQIIQDSVEQKVEDQGYISIKRYGRVLARLATARPDTAEKIPPFNPFKLYSDPTPIAEAGNGESGKEAGRAVSVQVIEFENGVIPAEDSHELSTPQVAELVAANYERRRETPHVMRPAILPGSDSSAGANDVGVNMVHRAAYHPGRDRLLAHARRGDEMPPATSIVEKSWAESEDETLRNTEFRSVTIERGDTLMSVLTEAGAETWQAKAIAEAMAPEFTAKSLRKGQEIRFGLAPAPGDAAQMEPVRISLFSGERHEVTVKRDAAGEYVASDTPIDAEEAARKSRQPERATLYASFYDAALNQDLPPGMIRRLLRIHSYDADFKRKVQPGDRFEVFFGLGGDGKGKNNAPDEDLEPGELLYTAMTVGGETRRFFRFRTPDGGVDFYDRNGNSAKKFLMRQPVKNARFTSGFGMRDHPILGRKRMHTGTDWAASRGTPILAAGDGVIETAERKGGHGNYVRIRHANGFKTSYSHMAKFAKGLRPGIKVTQGQVIGYVGSTGLSTGAHLHYEVLVNNRHVNPMTIHVPRGRQLTGKQLAAFHEERERIEALMRRAPVTTRVAAATTDAR